MNNPILEKVKRLLSLSNNNTNVNEAASAFKAAQRLLSEHRLSMADIDGLTDEDAIGVDDDGLYVGKRAITWKGQLGIGIAQCNGCDVYWCHVAGGKKSLKAVGRQSNIDIVRWLYRSVSAQIDWLCKSAMLHQGSGGKTFSNSFRLGAVSAVIVRLKEAKKEVEQAYDGTHALVLVKNQDAAVKQFMGTLGLRKRQVNSRYNGNAYNQGKSAGGRVNLSRGGLGQGGSRNQLR